MPTDYELNVHRRWIGLLQPVGLVVSAPALCAAQAFPDANILHEQQALLALISPPAPPTREGRKPPPPGPLRPLRFADLATRVLGWKAAKLVEGAALPEELSVVLPEFGETLRPTYAVPGIKEREDDPAWLLLVQELPDKTDLDRGDESLRWQASPQVRFERLLRETGVPLGILINGRMIRLVHAPRGESSGHLTWPIHRLGTALDRVMLEVLCMLLGRDRLFTMPREQRLPHILRESRKYQNVVSNKLAGQVLEALNELLRGFQAANEVTHGALLDATVRDDPDHLYGGLLAVLLRLVFVLYAEERGLISSTATYVRNYSLVSLFDRLRADEGRFPDTMDLRYGAWSRVLVLFRMVHDGAARGDLRLPPRYGHLFDPDGWAFLEGRPYRVRRVIGDPVAVPRVPDGVVLRVLQKLLLLDRERLSYRALDVEQIGSVYENMMGFRLERARETSIGLGKDHVVVGLDTLLAKKGAEREKHLKETADVELSGKASEALRQARTIDELVAALERRISPLTPRTVGPGGLYLQPTDERRRSGSHYTPRELTEPIVRTTLRPILEDLGPRPTPAQILALKVCDPAMGSGAFLVETCRQLAEQLVRAYDAHERPTDVPPDEDILLYAQRQVAQRCLYGVDKNPLAVDLGKLSLWLATLARDHAFTFLDHSIRHGDSLVGLSREQIASFHWAPERQVPVLRGLVDKVIDRALALRALIPDLANSDDVHEKQRLLNDADSAIAQVRTIADAAVAAFFSEDKAKAREEARQRWETRVLVSLPGELPREITDLAADLRSGAQAVPCFHWEIEFPEVFARETRGFDAIVGNPPFLGGSKLSTAFGTSYENWLKAAWPKLVGKLDLVVFFVHRSMELLSLFGTAAFVSTYRIADGANASIGLRPVTQDPWMIYWAHRERQWPGTAKTRISQLAFSRRSRRISCELDGLAVSHIACDLRASTDLSGAQDLLANESLSFIGAKPDSLGFMISDEERQQILSRQPDESLALRRYLIGNDLTKRPLSDGSRWIIDFSDFDEQTARDKFPQCFAIVTERVRPGRMALRRSTYRDRWWQYTEPQLRAHELARRLPRVVGISRVTKYVVWQWIDPCQVVSDKVAFVVLSDDAVFGLLHSCFHEYWALRRGGKFGVGGSFSYSPTTCFRSFPFPSWTKQQMEAIRLESSSLAKTRAAIAHRDAIGLTEIYNRFHDREIESPEIDDLRGHHERLDRLVAEAYGWDDLDLSRSWCSSIVGTGDSEDADEPEEKEVWRYAIGDDSRESLLQRLLALNAAQAKGQSSVPVAGKNGGAKAAGAAGEKKAAGGKKKAADEGGGEQGQGSLF